ncbi:MAG TPA: CHRD domain-containing protein [Actinophytocola sp.]|uniref:CHRD domain-containing protein n=1 Tax=Actinophytocola sp. TaxID=1872138 RepID=UPI002DDCF828|nr:CHRD domain-containing protein [Actinophytocola sp.]HEV2778845.1 CHRD domain-containing protein [Actinophytocola sp.]
MTRRKRLLAAAAVVGAALAVSVAGSAVTTADESSRGAQIFFREQLSPYAETPLALSTAASGQFRMQIDDRAQEITWRLSYADLSAPVTQAHIHFGSPAQTGGISVFLCTNQGNGPAGTQTCPEAPATITGTIRPADIIGPTGQGIAAGEFGELVAAARAGFTYVNVHCTLFPAGEIRAQLGHQH